MNYNLLSMKTTLRRLFFLFLFLSIFLGFSAQKAEAVSLYFTTNTDTGNPLSQLSLSPNQQTILNVYLNAGLTNIDGFDMVLSYGNGITISNTLQGADASSKFNKLLFNSFDPVGKTYHLVKVQNNLSTPAINGILHLATVTVTAGSTNATGSITFPALTITSTTSTNPLSVSPNPVLSYTVAVLPTATPIPPTSTPTLTATPVPGATRLAFNLSLQGLGTGGNPTPQHSQKNVTVQLFNASNVQVGPDKTGLLTYANGNYAGTIDVGVIPSGNYTIKVKADKYLRKLMPGIQVINTGTTYTVPTATLIVGDINGDNIIDVLDFGILQNCYGAKANTPTCGAFKSLADLDDNGAIEGVDVNLFIRSIATRIGD